MEFHLLRGFYVSSFFSVLLLLVLVKNVNSKIKSNTV